MNKIIIANFLSFAISSTYATPAWLDPEAFFDANLNQRTLSIVEWRISTDVQKDCEEESQTRKLGGFNYEVAACSFWLNDFCVIITSSQATIHQIGHELRHCFQENFH